MFLTDSSDISSIRTIDSNLFREQWSKTNIFYLHSLVCVTTSIRLTCFYTNWLCCHVCKNVYSFWAGENLHVLLYVYMDNVSIWSIWTPVSGSICLCLSRARTQISVPSQDTVFYLLVIVISMFVRNGSCCCGLSLCWTL